MMSGSVLIKSFLTIGLVIGGLVISLSGAAYADEAVTDVRGVSVKERPRPDYDAVGIRAGSFMIFPTASIGETYNDNIYAVDTDTTDDLITTLASSIAVNSNWNRHALNLNAGLSQYLYTDNSDEDNFNWNVGGDARIDILRDTNISLNAGYVQVHEDRGDPNATFAASEPTEYDMTTAGGSFFQRFNRLFGELGATYTKYDYKDNTTLLGAVIDEDDRDRDRVYRVLEVRL